MRETERRTVNVFAVPNVPSEHVPTRREEARARFGALLEAVSAND